jgi:radical SAM/Cys-rich protein
MPYSFRSKLDEHELRLDPLSVETLQVNITRLCNQACRHCHVGASPQRTEQMDRRTAERCLEILARYGEVRNLDITGGAPELHPDFDYIVTEARKLNKRVMVRHNLTVMIDGDPRTGADKSYLPQFFAAQQVEVIASLPHHQLRKVEMQRGRGVFGKSIEAMRLLNSHGYGMRDSGLILNLVHNPAGDSLPHDQKRLEDEFRLKLRSSFGLEFNSLYTMTNAPINRFRDVLLRAGTFDRYMGNLVRAFNPSVATGVMCRTLVSVGYDGRLYDCDFNQMTGIQIKAGKPMTVFDFDYDALTSREIRFASHCFACTAGAGST